MSTSLSKACARYLIGKGAIEKAGDLCNDLGLEGNAVLINDEVTWKIAGKRLTEVLKEYGFRKVETTIVENGKKSFKERASWQEIEKGVKLVRKIRPSVLFGVGGGVNMDLSRAIAFRWGIPFMTVPTILATEAQAVPWGVIYNVSDDYRATLTIDYPPIAVIADTDIIKEAPWRFQAAGFGDYLVKMSSIEDWKLAHSHKKVPYNEFVVGIMRAGAEVLMKKAAAIKRKEEEAFNAFVQIMISDGYLVTLMGPGNPAAPYTVAGSEHVVGVEIAKFAPLSLHGEQVALGTIMMVCLQGGDWKAVKRAMEDVGTPVTAGQIGLSDEGLVKALVASSKTAKTAAMYSILNEKPLTEKSAEKLARETGVIK